VIDPGVGERVLAWVADHQLQPLKYKDLAAAMDISRAGARSAVMHLAAWGLVRIVESRRGPTGGVVLEGVSS